MSDALHDDLDFDTRVKKWIPIENNSELLTEYIHELGVQSQYSIVDIYGTDPELLSMLEYEQLYGIILLFPYSDNFKRSRKQQADTITYKPDSEIYFLPQIVSNACGTVAITHALLNNRKLLTDNSVLSQFYNNTKSLDNKQRAYALAENTDIETLHHKYSVQGDTAVETDVDVHYNAFIRYSNHLYELDGTKKQPIDHGVLHDESDDTFLRQAIDVIKTKFMDNDPDNIKFSIQALIKTPT